MLERITIENVALIEKAEVEFEPGVNILSGETGAGKSVILDSINFVLGAKADKTMIRTGADYCLVSAVFLPGEDTELSPLLAEQDLPEDEEIIITRKLRRDGRGDIRLNGRAVNATMLRKITSRLVDVHGQSDHFLLLSESNQLRLVDRAAGAPLAREKEKLASLLKENREIRQSLQEIGGDEGERSRRIDILSFQIKEIAEADLKEGEEEALKERQLFFRNAEKIAEALSESADLLGGENGVVDQAGSAARRIGQISRYAGEYRALYDRLDALSSEAEDLAETVSDLLSETEYDEREAEETEERLDLLSALKKKYGGSVPAVLQTREKLEAQYALLTHSDEEYARLSGELAKNTAKVYAVSERISALRRAAAKEFCAGVERELQSLSIPDAKFEAEFAAFSEEDAEKATANGLDTMRFLFSANAGEPLKPLAKVISGGEMSRLMLAVKTQKAGRGGAGTYLFDEIDAGISGRTAKRVAEKFTEIGRDTQIIAVSHLAPIAACADANFLISKHTEGGAARTTIEPLTNEGKKEELVRLLGASEGQAARELAEDLLREAGARKKTSA